MSRRLAAAVTLVVGSATIDPRGRRGGERVPPRPDPDRLRVSPVVRLVRRYAAGTGHGRRASRSLRSRSRGPCGPGDRWFAGRRSPRPRGAARHAGGRAADAARACRSPAGRGTEARGALLQPQSGGGKAERFRSGGGKAERFSVAKEARARGIEPIELTPGDDLETLVRAAVERGADALAMAGGDGSQAVVAAVAAERGAALRVHSGGHRATTSRWTSASTVTMSSAHSTRSSTAASAPWTSPRSTAAGVRQQRLARPVHRDVQHDEYATRSSDAARHRAGRDGCRRRGTARPALERAGWPGPPGGCRGPGLQQLLPARPRPRVPIRLEARVEPRSGELAGGRLQRQGPGRAMRQSRT